MLRADDLSQMPRLAYDARHDLRCGAAVPKNNYSLVGDLNVAAPARSVEDRALERFDPWDSEISRTDKLTAGGENKLGFVYIDAISREVSDA